MANEPLHMRLLGRELKELREIAGVSKDAAASRIDRKPLSIHRHEIGATLPDALQLEVLCDLYGIDDARRGRLMSIRELAAKPPWWTGLGKRPDATATMLSLESAAYRIRQYDAVFVPGLLQTPEYARAIIEAVDPSISPRQLTKDTTLRMGRQERVWSDNPPGVTYLLDESALLRMPRDVEVQRGQLRRLLSPPTGATVLIVPLNAGPHPSQGTYVIFYVQFDTETEPMTGSGPAGVHVETPVSELGSIVESDAEMRLYELAWERTRASALSPVASVALIEERLNQIDD